MEYTINQLARLSGVSSRTLRYYDQIQLLSPARREENDYRIYGPEEVDRLQQILFYRALDVRLEQIKLLLDQPDFDREAVLRSHLKTLRAQKTQLEALIDNVNQTLRTWKGETTMQDAEKFKGMKQDLINQNEAAYGEELRSCYGSGTLERSNQKLLDMTPSQFEQAKALEASIQQLLIEAVKEGSPSSAKAQTLCRHHKEWLCLYWPEGTYSQAAHRELGELYVEDPRFQSYYEKICPGGAEFLRDALRFFCSNG